MISKSVRGKRTLKSHVEGFGKVNSLKIKATNETSKIKLENAFLPQFIFAPLQSQTGKEELKNGRKWGFTPVLGQDNPRLFCNQPLIIENVFRSLQTRKRGV